MVSHRTAFLSASTWHLAFGCFLMVMPHFFLTDIVYVVPKGANESPVANGILRMLGALFTSMGSFECALALGASTDKARHHARIGGAFANLSIVLIQAFDSYHFPETFQWVSSFGPFWAIQGVMLLLILTSDNSDLRKSDKATR